MVPTDVMDTVQAGEEVVKEIEGACGVIRIIKSPHPASESDEDIHALVARVLLMKLKRLASSDPIA